MCGGENGDAHGQLLAWMLTFGSLWDELVRDGRSRLLISCVYVGGVNANGAAIYVSPVSPDSSTKRHVG